MTGQEAELARRLRDGARITPRAGVRIETLRANQRGEISRNRATRDAGQSLLAQECGLKLRGDSTGR